MTPFYINLLKYFYSFLWKCVKVKRAMMRISIRWVWGVDKQDSICIMEFLLCTINNNLMLSQNIPFHHKMIIYLNTKMFFLLFSYAYSEICSRENKESFMLSATSYLLWPPADRIQCISFWYAFAELSPWGFKVLLLSFLAPFDDSLQLENSHRASLPFCRFTFDVTC